MKKLANILADCNKVEYLLYDFGISFESPTPGEVGRFYSYIKNEPADEKLCRKGQYDGAVVFKNSEGDIKISMELNIFRGCNRVVFNIDKKKYAHPLSDKGLQFFQQVLGKQKQMIEGSGK